MHKLKITCLHLLLGLLLFNTSCLKKNYDNPPDLSSYDPQLPVNITIAELKAHYKGSAAQVIDNDWTIYGIVTADDRSGNFYKQIVLDDGTGGISVNLDGNSLYAKYPIGRKLYVKLKGLYYGQEAKLPMLGGMPDNTGEVSRIPGATIDNHVVRANFPNPLPTIVFDGLSSLSELNDAMLNRLIRVDNVQVTDEDTGKTFALPPSITSATNVYIRDCDGNRMMLRTSGYASFQGARLPKGKGTITAVYSTFNDVPQLFIRDTTDVQFHASRCKDKDTTQVATTVISIDSLRKMYNGSGIKLSSCKIKGIVTSDASKKNISSGSIVLQDGSKGVLVYWGGTVSYKPGDSILLDVSGDSLILYQGALEVKRTPGAARPAPLVVDRPVMPVSITIADLTANFSEYESVLVNISNAWVLGGGTYSGNKTLTDGTGNITLYTMPGAVFSGQMVPSLPKTFVGIATPFTGSVTKELKLRDPDIDVF